MLFAYGSKSPLQATENKAIPFFAPCFSANISCLRMFGTVDAATPAFSVNTTDAVGHTAQGATPTELFTTQAILAHSEDPRRLYRIGSCCRCLFEEKKKRKRAQNNGKFMCSTCLKIPQRPPAPPEATLLELFTPRGLADHGEDPSRWSYCCGNECFPLYAAKKK